MCTYVINRLIYKSFVKKHFNFISIKILNRLRTTLLSILTENPKVSVLLLKQLLG